MSEAKTEEGVYVLSFGKRFIPFITAVLFFLSSASLAGTVKNPLISKKLVLKASKQKVWRALTSSKDLGEWWNKGVKLETFVGGEFYEPWGDGQLATGKVLEVHPLELITFTWREKYWELSKKTKCSFSLKESSGSTVVYVEHSGWEVFKDVKKRKRLVKGFHQGWDALLPKLKKYIESKGDFK